MGGGKWLRDTRWLVPRRGGTRARTGRLFGERRLPCAMQRDAVGATGCGRRVAGSAASVRRRTPMAAVGWSCVRRGGGRRVTIGRRGGVRSPLLLRRASGTTTTSIAATIVSPPLDPTVPTLAPAVPVSASSRIMLPLVLAFGGAAACWPRRQRRGAAAAAVGRQQVVRHRGCLLPAYLHPLLETNGADARS